MGRGRPRKPTAQLKLHGTYRHDRRFEDEPTPEIDIPEMPSHLTGEAKKEWDRLAPLLARRKCVTHWDRALLSAYCYEWGLYVELCKKVKPKNLTILTTKGNVVQNPLLTARNRALKNLKELATEFGLSPCSRTKLSVGESQTVNPFEKILNAG